MPRGRAVKASQCLRLAMRAPGRISVPTGSPAATFSSTSWRRPLHSTVAAPERPAEAAAWSFVAMPPRPKALPGPPARLRSSSVTDSTTSSSGGSGSPGSGGRS